MRRFAAVAALALALGACEFGAEISVNEDGSGTFGFSFVIDNQFLALLAGLPGSEGGDPFAEFRDELTAGPVPFDVEDFTTPDGRGVRATTDFTDVEDLRRKMAEADDSETGSALGSSGAGFGDFVLERRGSGWHFEAVSEAPDLGDFGDLGEGDEEFPFDPSQIAELLKLTFQVTLPGREDSSNATDKEFKDGRTKFTWTSGIAEGDPAPQTMVASTSNAGAGSGGGFPTVPVAATVGGLALAGIAAATVMRRKTQAIPAPPPNVVWPPAGDASGAPAPPPPGGAPPAGPPPPGGAPPAGPPPPGPPPPGPPPAP